MNARLAILAAALALPACQTVSIPDFGGQLAEFRSDLDDLDRDFMQADEIPGAPQGVRSDAEWDASAREMQALRDGFETPPLEPALSPGAFDREFRAAQDYADAYKDDDPK